MVALVGERERYNYQEGIAFIDHIRFISYASTVNMERGQGLVVGIKGCDMRPPNIAILRFSPGVLVHILLWIA